MAPILALSTFNPPNYINISSFELCMFLRIIFLTGFCQALNGSLYPANCTMILPSSHSPGAAYICAARNGDGPAQECGEEGSKRSFMKRKEEKLSTTGPQGAKKFPANIEVNGSHHIPALAAGMVGMASSQVARHLVPTPHAGTLELARGGPLIPLCETAAAVEVAVLLPRKPAIGFCG